MTRLPTRQRAPEKPTSVTLGETAIASGLAGLSLTLRYCDYPAPLLCQLLKYFARAVEPSAVLHVRGQADIQKIPARIANLRIVFVQSPRYHNDTAWAVQMATPSDGTDSPGTTVFSVGTADDADEDPGITLLLRCNAGESDAVTRWLAGGSHLPGNWAHTPQVTTAAPGPLSPVTGSPQDAPADRWRWRFRDCQIVNGLLTGACLIRALGDRDEANVSRTMTLNDYELVRLLLQSSVVCPADETFDALATTMIHRANVYLGVKYGDDSSPLNPFYAVAAPSRRSFVAPAPLQLISRKEIADLGNARSNTVRSLVEYLQRTNAYGAYSRMGFTGRTPPRENWQRRSVDSLAGPLLIWSIKKVRTHFEQLQKTGMVAAERDRANGPWLYALPEELTHVSNPFRDLPPATELGRNIATPG